MRRSSLTLSGLIIALIVGLALTLSQETLLAQQATVTETGTPATKDNSKPVKKGTHKGKKHLKKGNKSEVLSEGKKVKVQEIAKTGKKEKEEFGEKIEPKKDK